MVNDEFIYEVECYKHRWLLDLIIGAIDRKSHIITNTDKLQQRVMNYVGEYLVKEENGINHKAHLRRMVHEKISESSARFGKQDAVHYEEFNSEEKEAPSYEPPDILANVETIVTRRDSLESTIISLAGDNMKMRTALSALASGYKVVETSNILAHVHGGEASGHRSSIKRFIQKRRAAVS